MKRALLLVALLVCATIAYAQPLPRPDTWIPASKVRITGLTSTKLQDAVDDGEVASNALPYGPALVRHLREYRVWFEDFNDCSSVTNVPLCVTTPGFVEQTTGGFIATPIGTITTGALAWRGSGGDKMRIYPDATANEGYWVQWGSAGSSIASYMTTPLAGRTIYFEIGLIQPNLANRDIFVGLSEGSQVLLQADGTFTGSTNKQHAGFHLLQSAAETHFRTTYCAVTISNTVRGTVAISNSPPTGGNLLVDRYGVKITGLDIIDFYYAAPGETEMTLVQTVSPMAIPLQGLSYGLTPSVGIVGNGNANYDLEIDYMMLVESRAGGHPE